MKDRDQGSSPASASPPRRKATRQARPGWLPWTMVVATVAGAMAALAFGGRPIGTVALPPAATITPRPLTAAHSGTGGLGVGAVTVVAPIRPVEVFDAAADAATPRWSDTGASAPSGTTRTGTPGSSESSGSSGSPAPTGNAGTGALGAGGGGGGGAGGTTPGATTTTTTTFPSGGSTDGSDDTTNDGSDDPGATATTTVGTGPGNNERVGTVPTGS